MNAADAVVLAVMFAGLYGWLGWSEWLDHKYRSPCDCDDDIEEST